VAQASDELRDLEEEARTARPVPVLRRTVISVGLAVVLLGAGWVVHERLTALREAPNREERSARAIAVRVVSLGRTNYQERLVGYGRARALRRTRVAAEVTGAVRWVAPALQAGVAVRPTDELVRLDDRDLRQALQSARARRGKTRAEAKRLATDLETNGKKLALSREELEASEREVSRIEGLEGRGGATKSELDKERLRFLVRRGAVLELEGRDASLQAQIERNRAESAENEAAIAEAQLDLARTVIHPPFAGTIVEKEIEVGAWVAPGTMLFELVDLSRVEIPVALPASRYGEVELGAPAAVRIGTNVEPRRGTIARLAPRVSTENRTFYAYVVIENLAGAAHVPPGAFVTAQVDGRRFVDVIVVPRTAFVGRQVFVHIDGVARVREPSIRYTLPHVLIADGGLEEGDELILTNLEEIADGTRVAPIRREPAPEDS
jgi:RND family efflux transporter MFP subunit